MVHALPTMFKTLAAVAALAIAAGAQAQVSVAGKDLELYGIPLKNAKTSDFLRSAKAAGVESTSFFATSHDQIFYARRAGVPGLSQFALLEDQGVVLSLRFDVSNDPKESSNLRALLVRKYGEPAVLVGSRTIGMKFAAAAAPAAPDGIYEWQFAQGMKLVYAQPVNSAGATLTYADTEATAKWERSARDASSRFASDASQKQMAGIINNY